MTASRKGPPVPSSFVLGEKDEDEGANSRPGRREENLNPHLDLENIEARMQNSMARQMLRMFRENPDLAAAAVKGMVKKG